MKGERVRRVRACYPYADTRARARAAHVWIASERAGACVRVRARAFTCVRVRARVRPVRVTRACFRERHVHACAARACTCVHRAGACARGEFHLSRRVAASPRTPSRPPPRAARSPRRRAGEAPCNTRMRGHARVLCRPSAQ
eukprot:5934516-Pleurochrysis_carterae.AAC.1